MKFEGKHYCVELNHVSAARKDGYYVGEKYNLFGYLDGKEIVDSFVILVSGNIEDFGNYTLEGWELREKLWKEEKLSEWEKEFAEIKAKYKNKFVTK